MVGNLAAGAASCPSGTAVHPEPRLHEQVKIIRDQGETVEDLSDGLPPYEAATKIGHVVNRLCPRWPMRFVSLYGILLVELMPSMI